MEANNIRPFLIGICGGSSTGKTLLLEEISSSIKSEYKVCKISIVDYYKNLSPEDYKKKKYIILISLMLLILNYYTQICNHC